MDNLTEVQVYHYRFINNVFGSFVKGMADFLRNGFLFDRTKEVVIATYEKAFQYYQNKKTSVNPNQTPIKYPLITLDSDFEFEPDPQAGRFFHGYPNFVPSYASKLYGPEIYKDDNLLITPVLNRYVGRFEIIVWCESVYSMIDYRMRTYQFFGGTDRPIYPVLVNSFIVIPDELEYYTYDNPYTKQTYQIDWDNNGTPAILIKNINQNKHIFPFQITPWLKLTGVGSNKDSYGGSGDELSDHRLIISLDWECSLPTHLVFVSDKFPNTTDKTICDISAGGGYAMLNVPNAKIRGDIRIDKWTPKISEENAKYEILQIINKYMGGPIETKQILTEQIYDIGNPFSDLDELENSIDNILPSSLSETKKYNLIRELLADWRKYFITEDYSKAVNRESVRITSCEINGSISEDIELKTVYNYMITEEDVTLLQNTQSDQTLVINLLEPVLKQADLKIFARYGELMPDIHWNLLENNKIQLFGFANNEFSEGELLNILYYGPIEN